MPFPFALPTTSALPFSRFLRCDTHPSLILAATTRRNVLRALLKRYSKLSPSLQPSALSSILTAINDYLSYLLAIEAGLSSHPVGDEEVDVCLAKEIEVAWSPRLSGSVPGRDFVRVKGKGLDYEICFVLTTLAFTHSLLARQQLHGLYATTVPSPEERTKAIQLASTHFLSAQSIHQSVSTRSSDFAPPQAARDITSETQTALADLALAEATLLYVLKNDPYPAVVIQSRNKDDREWMYKAPDIKGAVAGISARLSIQAAEHAGTSRALLSSVNDEIEKYARNLQRASKAKACRFCGVQAEIGGKVGEAIAWCNAGRKELGHKVDESGSKKKSLGLSKLKKEWTERREDKKIEKGEEWGADGGTFEEGRIIEMLEEKWNKSNDLINTQLIPPSDPLSSNMPSGRSIPDIRPFVPPSLDSDILARMRAPVDRSELAKEEAQSDDDSDAEGTDAVEAPGAFPPGSAQSSTYY